MSYPAKLDINIFIGLDFDLSMYMQDSNSENINLTGCQVTAQFRYKSSDLEPVNFAGSIDIPTAKITIAIPQSVTSTMKAEIGEYDLILTDANQKRKPLLAGQAKVILPVTRF